MRIYLINIPGLTGAAGPIEAFVSEELGRRMLDKLVKLEIDAINREKGRSFERLNNDFDALPDRPESVPDRAVLLASRTIQHTVHNSPMPPHASLKKPLHKTLTFRLYEVTLTGSPLEAIAAQAE